CAHPGLETVVFSHSRNGCQLELNATRVDLESTGTVQAGFNIQAGDVIKVFVVDNLTNATDHNPIVMQ
ncbi:MAG: metallophosphoesterase, partial [Syntrophomonas sp.]